MTLFGSETPRVFTPPLRELTPDTTWGFGAITFAHDVLGVELLPWQRWLLLHALEVLPDGSFRFRNVVVLVARQNGKSTLSQVLALFFLFVLDVALVLGTAQDLDTAEEVWEGAQDMVEGTPELAELANKPTRINGRKSTNLKSGQRYKVRAASRKAGRGLSGDLILLDELREHQTWDAWGAITKTTMARPNAQIWALSNAGDMASVVLRYLRLMAHKSLGDPDGINAAEDPASLLGDADLDADEAEQIAEEADDSLGIFEWSAEPGRPVGDKDGWVAANPGLGYTISERTIASAARTDPEWVFRTEVLCQWSSGALEGPFPAGSWEAGTDAASTIPADERFAFCLDVSWDRTRSSIGVAGRRADGTPHVEVVANRVGTDWVTKWLVERKDDPRLIGVAVQQRGAPASSLVEPLVEAGVPVVEWPGTELGTATGRFYDAVRGGEDGVPQVFHVPQPVLDVSAATAKIKPLADAYVWDRKASPVDASPLVAVTGAFWLLGKPEEKPMVSAYDDGYDYGLLVI